MLHFTEYSKFLVALLATLNPLGIIPTYISLTSDYSEKERKSIAHLVVVAVTTILLVAAFFGQYILNFFGISIDSFRVGGGIMVLLMAIKMLNTSHSASHQNNSLVEHAGESIAVVPLAMPLLAGPGAISTTIINSYKGHGFQQYLMMSIDILLLGLILAFMFRMIPKIARHMSIVGINISTRIMGLILAAIAIEFIADGLKGLFSVLN